MAQNIQPVEGPLEIGEAPEVMNPAAPSQPDPSVAASPSCTCGNSCGCGTVAAGTFYFQATPIPPQYQITTTPVTAGYTLHVPTVTVLPDEYFTNPLLASPTPITITDDGHIFGHLAAWSSCHTGYQNSCVRPPISASNYSYFLTGESVLASGSHIPTGVITFNTGHPGLDADARGAIAHYDNTGTVAADVAIGEDEIGIWVAGAVRNTDPGVLRILRASALSGDWRPIEGHLELVAALAVNTPGFPISRTLAASGELTPMTGINVVGGELPVLVASVVRKLRGLEADADVTVEDATEVLTELLDEPVESTASTDDTSTTIPIDELSTPSCQHCGQIIPEPVIPLDPTEVVLKATADMIRRQVLHAI